MRIAIGVGGEVTGTPMSPQDIVDNYRRLLVREGVSSLGAVTIVGTEADIEQQIGRRSDVGVTELWPIVFPVGDGAAGGRRQTRALLAELAGATRPR
jgi:hypothetical protein